MISARRLTKVALFSLLISASAPAAAWAQDGTIAPADDKVVAIVNGHEIKISEVQMATDDIIGQLPDLPPKLRYPFVVEFLVERHLLAQLAVKDGIAETEEYKRRLALYQAKALRDAYFFQKIRPQVTEDQIKAAYDAESAKVAQTERVRARHILVASEQEARDIEAKLAGGEKFEELAKKYSLDGSKDYGGDLGYFTAPEMVAEFSKAAFALKTGELSQPVKTDFGWHIIKVEDRKMGGAQPYDQVKTALRNILLRKKTQEKILTLRLQSKVELKDPDLVRFADDARKLRQQMVEQRKLKQQGGSDQSNDTIDAPALTGDDGAGEGASGKGDMQAPQQ